MNIHGQPEAGSELDSFLNHDFFANPTGRDEEQQSEFSLMDSPSTDDQNQSPQSIPSFETSDTFSSDLGSLAPPVPFGMPPSQAVNLGLGSLHFDGHQASNVGPQAFPVSMPFRVGHGPEAAIPHTQMWRSPSDGAGLSHSISSLALDGKPPLAAPSFLPTGVVIKQEEQAGPSFFNGFSFPGVVEATPMQASVSLPGTSVSSPSSEKKRKLSVSESGASKQQSPGSEAQKGPKSSSGSKKTTKKRNNSAASAAVKKSADDAPTPQDDSAFDMEEEDPNSPKRSNQRRPPPSASQVTEAGKPFPVIDTSAKHSSLFVPPDTSGLTKREARLVKNRAAAFLSRQRKREQFEELEFKCKAMSKMGWRLWEVIAGPDAPVEALSQTVIPAMFSEEDPLVGSCLEQIIAKRGATIAPTADDPPMTFNDGEKARSPSRPPLSTNEDAQGNGAELERLRTELAAAHQREQDLISRIEALQRSQVHATVPSSVGAAVPAPALPSPVQTAPMWSVQSSIMPNQESLMPEHARHSAAPFKSSLPFDPSLTFAPDLMPQVDLSRRGVSPFVPSQNAGQRTGAMVKKECTDTVDFTSTPTIETFTEAAIKTKWTQRQRRSSPNFGLGLGDGSLSSATSQISGLSMPSSPSSLSSFSSENADQPEGTTSCPNNPRMTAGSVAIMVILFGIALLGMPSGDLARLGINRSNESINSGFSLGRVLGPVTQSTGYSLIDPSMDEEEDDEMNHLVASNQPSSHLSDTDLSLESELRTPVIRDHASIFKTSDTPMDGIESTMDPQETDSDSLDQLAGAYEEYMSRKRGTGSRQGVAELLGTTALIAATATIASVGQKSDRAKQRT